jgi:hypothetical protein
MESMKTNPARVHVKARSVAEFLANGGKVTRLPSADEAAVTLAHLADDCLPEVARTAMETVKLAADAKWKETKASLAALDRTRREREYFRQSREEGLDMDHALLER